MQPIKNVLSVSGGKDSTAMYLHALDHDCEFEPVFADVGNEHEDTLEYVARLHERTGGPKVRVVRMDFTESQFEAKRRTIKEEWPKQGVPQEVVDRAYNHCHKTGVPFVDISLLMSGFPSPRRRFCTERLKINPMLHLVFRPIWEAGFVLCNWQGIRRDESHYRSKLGMWEKKRYRYQGKGTAYIFRPLIDWSVSDVWAMHRRHNLKPNPLYAKGAKRVGCYPCIYAGKSEIRRMAENDPEHVARIEEWEGIVALVSKQVNSQATFIPAQTLNGETITTEQHGIRNTVEWSKTSRSKRQYDFLPPPPVTGYVCDDDTRFLGLCE